MDDRETQKRYEQLSPFELKEELIRLARSSRERIMLDAGRGNPNWLADAPRHAFLRLSDFALAEAKRSFDRPGLAGAPSEAGLADRLDGFIARQSGAPGVDFLGAALAFARDSLAIDGQSLACELVDAVLGDHYPTPDRMLSCCEAIVRAYLEAELGGGGPPRGRLQLFATEGGTAAMAYVFNSLSENRLLRRGDKIALGAPIFSPYLEIPRLNDFAFVELEVGQSEDAGWQYPEAAIETLADPAIKAFFVVNPSNPTSVAIDPRTLDLIAELVETRRRDLILLSDDVYATSVEGFQSLAARCPRNAILVYSFSKFFGATGWRLGVIGIHEDNVFDEAIAALPEPERAALTRRYGGVALEPEKMKLIDRMVADSRAVALHHTAGLSTPQQAMMTLFALFGLLDRAGGSAYRKATRAIVRHRLEILFGALDLPAPRDVLSADYYVTIDVPRLAAQRYGTAFRDWLLDAHEPIDFIWRLARERQIVLMDGGGFDAPKMSVRVSLANLPDEAYGEIGRAIGALLGEYHAAWLGGA